MVLNELKTQHIKRIFDVTAKKDLIAYRHYIKQRRWGEQGCPFELEWPWTSIPDMIAHKIAEHAVENL